MRMSSFLKGFWHEEENVLNQDGLFGVRGINNVEEKSWSGLAAVSGFYSSPGWFIIRHEGCPDDSPRRTVRWVIVVAIGDE